MNVPFFRNSHVNVCTESSASKLLESFHNCDDWKYRILEDGTAEIVEYNKWDENGPVYADTIPAELDGITVSSIDGIRNDLGVYEPNSGYFGFEGNIDIPDCVRTIKGNPFALCKITGFTVSANHPTLEVIEGFLFNKTEKKLIAAPYHNGTCYIPEGTISIGINAMGLNQIKAYVFPDSLTTLEDYAFGNESIDMPPNIQIKIPNTITHVGNNPAFGMCEFDQFIVDDDHPTLEIYKGGLISKPDHRLIMVSKNAKKYEIPDGTEIIGAYAFCLSRISTLVVPEGVRIIGNQAFTGFNFKSISLPRSIESIGDMRNSLTITKAVFTVVSNTYAYEWARKNQCKTKIIESVSSIQLNTNEVTIKTGKSITVNAKVEPSKAKNKKVEWISTDPSIATVNKGKIKGIGAGSCDIICRALDGSEVEAICHVTVEE